MKEREFFFSVILSVYNVAPYIREAMDSLISQDYGFENIQIIMVDDGSTDGSGEICDEYAQKYPDNTLVIHKENGG
ncbi:MAG: glycosyltransferase family 2 protein, partial [bacterium]|nr:glycosyltransferase family 2 protein [bacterium]